MTMVVDLDAPSTYEGLDSSRMCDRLASLPDQCRRAWDQGLAFALPQTHRSVRRVVVVGMGGSAVGGLLLSDLLDPEPAPPLTVCRTYSLPHHVGRDSLVLVSSYSGNTEETLSVFHQAQARGCKVVCLTSGGRLAEEARGRGIPLFTIPYQGEPRTALGFSLLAPLAILQGLGLVVDKTPQVEETLDVLRARVAELRQEVPLESNGAKTLARSLAGRITLVYGSGLLRGVAYRWKTQINENAKAWAVAEELPELDHNSIGGYQSPPLGDQVAVVFLSSAYLHPRVGLRYELTMEVLREAGIPYTLVNARGESPLAHILSTAVMGDYTSYYLAMLNGVDPSPIPTIDRLKRRLSHS